MTEQYRVESQHGKIYKYDREKAAYLYFCNTVKGETAKETIRRVEEEQDQAQNASDYLI